MVAFCVSRSGVDFFFSGEGVCACVVCWEVR